MLLFLIVAAVLGMLGLERVAISRITLHPAGREWVRHHRLLHPNSISLARFPMGLLSIGLWHLGYPITGLLWFSAWMISDLTDGTIARNCDLETETGKWLDPLSDKLMYIPPLLYFAWQGYLPWDWTLILIGIDVLGQGSRLISKKKAANLFGKAKTAFITILLTVTALWSMPDTGVSEWVTAAILGKMEMFAMLLAALSLYCKIIPDIWYANSLTLANFLCGVAAIAEAGRGHLIRAFVLVFIGQFFDLFDGRAARKFGSTRYGAIFDDIADGTSFGLAIGWLVYCGLAKPLAATPLLYWGGAAIALGYVVCVIYRLVRFLFPTVTYAPGIFQGLPSPAGAVLAGAGTLLAQELANELAGRSVGIRLAGLACVVLASVLMVSSIPYRHFGQHIWPSLSNMSKLLIFILVLALTSFSIADRNKGYHRWIFSGFCFTTITAYAIIGIQRRSQRALPPSDDKGKSHGSVET